VPAVPDEPGDRGRGRHGVGRAGGAVTARVGVVLFPGSNCELDAVEAVRRLGGEAEIVWHSEPKLPGVDAVVVPGGFAHGDYLRPGAIARFSPVMTAVAEFAAAGGPVVGICNGFQVLTEAGLLPGALQKNAGLKFVCTTVGLRVESDNSVLTSEASPGAVLRIPINHFEGNFTCAPETLAQLRSQDRVILRYVDNPNGSLDDIAGICSEGRNVVGLMPHPERASDPLLGSDDGVVLLRSLLATAAAAA
jgi:phosphoribosylformylglycinamidine synthase I